MSEQKTTTIPCVWYIKPHGMREPDTIEIPYDKEVEDKLAILGDLSIEITLEVFVETNEVNVCLDDGDFDYKFELFPLMTYTEDLINLIRNFDKEDYQREARERD